MVPLVLYLCQLKAFNTCKFVLEPFFCYWVVCCCKVSFPQPSLAYWFLSFTAINTALSNVPMACADCSLVSDTVFLMKRCVHEKEQLLV